MGDKAPLTFGEKLLALYARVAYMQKKGFNAHFKYKFLGEADVKAAVSAACQELGLVLSRVDAMPLGDITPKSAVIQVTVTIRDAVTVITHGYEDTEHITLSGIGAGVDSGDKGPMKAMAAALKYALTTGLLIATGDDPENDVSTDKDSFEAITEKLRAAIRDGNALAVKADIATFRDHPEFPKLLAEYKAAVKPTTEKG